MKRTLLIAVMTCGIAVHFGSGQLWARGGQGGGGGGGGHPSGGGGGHPSGGGGHPSGGGGHPSGGGGHPSGGGHPAGGGHPSGGGGHPAGGGGGGGATHTGGPTHPGGVVHPGGTTIHPSGTPGGTTGIHTGISGSPHVGPHPGGSSFTALHSGLVSGPGHVSNINHTGIAHQQFVGNRVNVGNRQINYANVNYRPSYYRHAGYYHGYWNGNRGYGYGGGPGYGRYGYGGYGGYGWGGYGGLGYGSGLGYGYGYGYGYRPLFWGLGGWGLGSLMYGSGYMGYSNPYYNSVGSNFGYNYSQPIPVSYNSPTSMSVAAVDPNNGVPVDPSTNVANPADTVMDSAVAEFKQNNYDAALSLVNQGITQAPDDAVLHEFRALILFAQGNYQQAAATIHSVLAVGPGWDWTTLIGFYNDVGLYTAQLQALENTVKQNPQDGAARFLLAYQYLTEGYPDAATQQLQQVVALVPNDQVAASLLKMTSAPAGPDATGAVAQPSPPTPVNVPQPPVNSSQPNPPTPVDPTSIVGNWKANRNDGSNFALTLTGDKNFTWSFTPKQQPPQTFDGTYSLDGNVIALERKGGGSLVAEIASNDGSKFNFKMVGAPTEDPGLTFIR